MLGLFYGIQAAGISIPSSRHIHFGAHLLSQARGLSDELERHDPNPQRCEGMAPIWLI